MKGIIFNGNTGEATEYDVTTDELADMIRTHRDILLSESDETQIPADKPTAGRQDWLDYRQALRDLTNQDGFPNNVTWPNKP